MNPKKTYIEVVLPLPVEGSFTYNVSDKFPEVVKGQRVVVQFGVRKIYTAIKRYQESFFWKRSFFK